MKISILQRYINYLLMILLMSFSHHTLAALSDGQAVNKAGLQRMLSQRIARNFLMIGLNQDIKNAQAELDKNVTLFEQNLMELQEYAVEKELKVSLEKIEKSWSSFRVLAVTKPNKESAVTVLRESDVLLQQSEELVSQIQKLTATKPTKLVGTSGRQRMLSQRIAKFYLALYWQVPYQGLEAALNQAMQDYEHGLVFLEKDSLNTPEITTHLLKVRAQWDFAKAGFKQYKEGRFIPVVIVHSTDTMLKQMNDITSLYVQIVQLASR